VASVSDTKQYLNGDGTMARGPDYTCIVVRGFLWSLISVVLQQPSRAGKARVNWLLIMA
jgi:hypothetical protein